MRERPGFCWHRRKGTRAASFLLAESALKAELGLFLRHLNGIFPREAAGAEALAALGQLCYAVGAEISEGVDADDLRDLRDRVAACDEVLAGVDVRPEIAGVEKRRRGHTHMNLRRAGLADELYDVGAGGAADDGVVDQYHTLAADGGGDGVELDVDGFLPLALLRLDKGAGDILVFDKAYAVRDAGLLGIAEGGVQAGVRNADDHVRLNGVLQRQKGSGALPRGVDAAAVYDGVRTGEVDVLKDAQRAGALAAMGGYAAQAALVRDDDLAGTHVPHELCTDAVQRAALGGKDPAVSQPSDAERPETVGIPDGDQLLGRHDDQRVRAFDPVHGGRDRLLDGGDPQTLVGDGIGNDLGVAGGVEYRTVELQRLPQLGGVCQVAVVGERHAALDMIDDQGLGVFAALPAGCGVADVPHRQLASAELLQALWREDLTDKAEVPISRYDAVVVDGNAAALLSPVLEREQGAVSQSGNIRPAAAVNAENAAFLMNL